VDLRSVRIVAGDYDVDDLDAAITPYLQSTARAMQLNIGDRKTLVFLPLIKTSRAFVETCCRLGMNAVHIEGDDPERADKLARFARGEFQILSNASLLLEGYDCPDIAGMVILRPTKSRPLYCQMVGRGTRIAPGKENLLLLDFLWQTTKHDLCVPASLIAKSETDAGAIMSVVSAAGSGGYAPMDLIDAETEAVAERERALAKKLREQTGKQRAFVDPIEMALAVDDIELVEYEPAMKWEYAPASDKQITLLRKFGLNVEQVTCKGHASRLIDRLIQRRNAGYCTVKQAQLLRKHGINATTISFDRAKVLITEIVEGAA